MHSSASSDIASAVSAGRQPVEQIGDRHPDHHAAHESSRASAAARLTIRRVDRGAFGAHRGDQPIDSLGARIEKNFRPLRAGQRQLGRDQFR